MVPSKKPRQFLRPDIWWICRFISVLSSGRVPVQISILHAENCLYGSACCINDGDMGDSKGSHNVLHRRCIPKSSKLKERNLELLLHQKLMSRRVCLKGMV